MMPEPVPRGMLRTSRDLGSRTCRDVEMQTTERFGQEAGKAIANA
jgi:hypothetical protein